jgi:hypothetical protein
MKRVVVGVGVIWAVVVLKIPAGELTVDGSLVVRTNLLVNGQLRSSSFVITNLAVSGEASFQHATIQHLPPQGDLGMGPYTNGVK